MSENNQIDEKFETLFEIHTKGYPKEIIGFMKERNISFKAWKIHDFKQDQQEIDEELPLIAIPKKLYKDLEDLCKINNLNTDDKIIEILGNMVFSAEISEEDGHKHVFNF